MRILLTGAGGFIGAHLWPRLAEAHDLLTVGRKPLGHAIHFEADLEDDSTLARLSDFAAQVIVHLAFAADADVCESEPERARRRGVEVTERLARAAMSCQRFVYVSTDLVFDGSRGGYDERSDPAPLSVYGQTKLEGERAARAVLGDRCLVVRLALVYGPRGDPASRPSFAETMIRTAAAGSPVTLFTDEFRSPVYVEDVASGLARLVELDRVPELLHFGGPERCSRHELGCLALDTFGISSAPVRRGLRADAGLRAPRPRDVSLDSSLARSLGLSARSPRDGLRAMKREMERAGFVVGS